MSWNIPLCDPSEASHPTVTPLPPPSLDPEECPRGPKQQHQPALVFLIKKETQSDIPVWDHVIVSFYTFSQVGMCFIFCGCFSQQHVFFQPMLFFGPGAKKLRLDSRPQLFLNPFVF